MKKSINLFVGLLLCVFAVSCGQPSVADLVEDANKEMVGKTENGITYQSITLEGKDIVYNCKVNDFNFADLGGAAVFEAAMNESFDVSMIKGALAGYKKAHKEMEIIVNEGCNVVFKFVDDNGEVATVTVPNAKLKEII